MLMLIVMGFVLVIAGWIAGELMGWPSLRIPCCLILIVACSVMAYGFGRLGAAFDTSIRITGAADTFFESTVDRLDEGEEARVHDELRRISDEMNWTYEGGSYAAKLDEASIRLGAGASEIDKTAD